MQTKNTSTWQGETAASEQVPSEGGAPLTREAGGEEGQKTAGEVEDKEQETRIELFLL